MFQKRFNICVLESNCSQSGAHVNAIKLLHLRTLKYLSCGTRISKGNFCPYITQALLKVGTIKFPWSPSVFVVNWPEQ